MKKFLFVLIALTLVSSFAFAQKSDADIYGTVLLPDGSAIPGVAVGLTGDVIGQMTTVIPVMRERLQRLISGPRAAVAAATAVRVAVSHYIVRSDDEDQFLDQLRLAVGIKK